MPNEITREISPLSYSREDENNGAYQVVNPRHGTRKKGRLSGGVRDKLTMGMMKARMSSLWRDGATYKAIAEQINDEFKLRGDLSITAANINYHIKAMLNYWREKGLLAIDERQAMILARYEQLEMIATEAYFKSCRGRYTKNEERQVSRIRRQETLDAMSAKARKDNAKLEKKGKKPKFQGDGEMEEAMFLTQERLKNYSRVDENEAGDPRWLVIMVDINHKRAQLWGLLNKSEMSNAEQELAKMPDDVREQRIAAVLNMAQKRQQGLVKTNLADPAPLGGFEEEEEKAGPVDVDDEPGWEDTDPDFTEDGVEVDFD